MGRGHRVVLPGASVLEPRLQGSLDRLCGIYSVINAASLASFTLSPITKRQRQRMFDQGVRFLDKEEQLRGVNLYGLGERRWNALRNDMLTALLQSGGLALIASRLLPRRRHAIDTVVDAIIEQIDQGNPVSIALWGAYDHFTVVAGYSRTSLILFDSCGYQRVKRRALGIKHHDMAARHRISIGSLTVVRAEQP